MVRFEDGFETVTSVASIKNKEVKHPFRPSVCGVGYHGIGAYNCPEYSRAKTKWLDMIHRVYDPKQYGYNLYGGRGVTVCGEWHNFQKFAAWIITQVGFDSNFQLDKDILGAKEKVYSPQTCCLVPKEINVAVMTRITPKKLMLGVSKTSNPVYRFRSRLHVKGLIRNLGVFTTETEAHRAYIEAKTHYVRSLAEEYKECLARNVYEKLSQWQVSDD